MKPLSAHATQPTRLELRPLRIRIALAIGVVLLIYVWFISAGLWLPWPRTAVYDYYSSLAAAFEKGQLYLDDRPSPELLALPDPYRIGARKNVDYIWDATLYKGHYFLYWGPVPALILIPGRLLFEIRTVPDLYLTFFFVAALFLILARLLWRVWARLFSDLPAWTLALGILLAGLAPPLTWMLNRPEVYEAALAGGQFFLLCGLYLCYSVVDGERHMTTRLVLASGCLGLAIGCRTSEAIPAAFLVLVMTAFILRERPPGASVVTAFSPILAIWLPLVVVISSLLWYNAARFGSILEFGYRFQLTLLQMPKHYDELFSTAYVLPNLYNYFVNPFTLARDFPPIRPQYGRTDLGSGISIPAIYFSEAVTGLILTFPFFTFAVGILPAGRGHSTPVGSERARRSGMVLRWLLLLVVGVLALEFAELLLFFFATERYLVQVLPCLTLAACMGWWQVSLAATSVPGRLRWISRAAVVLAILSFTSTTLLAVSSYQERILAFNPGLIAFLNALFRR